MDSCYSEANEEKFQALPLNCMPLSHQVAGHFFGKGRTKLGGYCSFKVVKEMNS